MSPSRSVPLTLRHGLWQRDFLKNRMGATSTESALTAIPQKHLSLWRRLLPLELPLAMAGAIFLLAAVLPLRELGFFEAVFSDSWSWVFWPTHILFPWWANITSGTDAGHAIGPSLLALSRIEAFMLLGTFLVVFLPYLIALYKLPQRVSYRYLLISTLLLGLLYVLIPIVTSQDVFLYIGYARMAILHHLNPLTTPPTAIRTDPVYSRIFWTQQPSLYGPTWIIPLAALQWLGLKLGLQSISPMILLLRLFGLTVHMGSTQLVWSLSGHLQHQEGSVSLLRRKQVTLAFGWNPLLLIEACVNVHADTLMLFLVLLFIWVLIRGREKDSDVAPGVWLCAAVVLALATGVKVNIAILVPGFLLYAWTRGHRLRTMLLISTGYLGTLVVLYAPFWAHGAIIDSLLVNPSSYRNVNSPAEFLYNSYRSIVHLWGFPPALSFISPLEKITHTLSILIFLGAYAWLCWKARNGLHTAVQMVYWMTIAWLVYCVFGSPWFWPWYAVTLFGLLMLVASVRNGYMPAWIRGLCKSSRFLPGITFLAFNILSLYCFLALGPQLSVIPGLPGFHWSYLRGLWISLLPFLVLVVPIMRRARQEKG